MNLVNSKLTEEFDGSPLAADEVALSHTEKIHLLAVDPSLDDYQHLHPVPDSLLMVFGVLLLLQEIWRISGIS